MKLRVNLFLELSLQAIIFYVSFTLLLLSCQNITPSKMKHTPRITIRDYGTLPSGELVKQYTLENNEGMSISILNYGGIITSLKVKNKGGKFENIVLGYDSLENYIDNDPYLGAIIGRVGNRIANGSFTLNGETYNLQVNNGPNHLHGGLKGFDKVVWEGKTQEDQEKVLLHLFYESAHMEEGYPGNLNTQVTYTLDNENQLIVSYKAQTDSTTIVNLTQHSYFNLSGDFNSTILDHQLQIDADAITTLNQNMIPTGSYTDLTDTPLDFRVLKSIGKDINSSDQQIEIAGGYDHNYVINTPSLDSSFAKVIHLNSGRVMEVYTDQPGVQLYTGNFLKAINDNYMGKRSGFCLETQHFPDSPNQSNFPSIVLYSGEVYSTTTKFKFSVQD